MEKGFKKLRGNRVYLSLPTEEKGRVIVDHNTKEDLQRAFAAKMLRATVYAVGEVTDIAEGDVVLVDPQALGKASIIPLNDGMSVVLVSPFDIIHIW